MYKITRETGPSLLTEAPTYIKRGASGCFVLCPEAQAAGIVHNGVPYHLLGRPELPGTETVMLLPVDGGSQVEQAALAGNLVFVALAEAGTLDPVTAGEHESLFAEWAWPVSYKTGQIRRFGGALYRAVCNPVIVAAGQNVMLTETPIACGRGYVCHRDGSGIITLRGITNQCRARYRVSASGNIAVAAGGTAGPISMSLAITGEPLNSATAIVTPAAVGDLFNVHVEAIINVPKGCCLTVALENTSTQAITAQNVNVIVDRVA